MKIALTGAGAGAFGEKHFAGLNHMEGVEVTSLVCQMLEATQKVAVKHSVGHVLDQLERQLASS